MSPIERITRISARQRERREHAARHRPRRHRSHACSLCWTRGHNKRTCPTRGISLWTNGDEILAACSADDAAALWNDPIGEGLEDLRTTPDRWTRVTESPLSLYIGDQEYRYLHAVWIWLLGGKGTLAIEGQVAEPWRSWDL